MPDGGAGEGHSPDTNSTSKADYPAEEGCFDKSRGHCKQFSDTKPACEDGNSAAATAITIESPESNSEVTATKPNSDRAKADVIDTQHLKRSWPSKASFTQLFGRWHPQTLLGVQIRVNPIHQSTVEAKLVPWTHGFSDTAGKVDTAGLHTRDEAERESSRHVCFFV